MSTCVSCPQVPVISEALGQRFIRRLALDARGPVLVKALEWLTERHEGLELYEGIHGRPYTNEEKDAIGAETGYVEGSLCPYFGPTGVCFVNALCADPPNEAERAAQRYYWLPTYLARTLAMDEFRSLVEKRLVADAKISVLTRPSGFYTREDVEKLRVPNVLRGNSYSGMYHI